MPNGLGSSSQASCEQHQKDNRRTCRGAARRSTGPQPWKHRVPNKGWWMHYSTYLAPWIPRDSGQRCVMKQHIPEMQAPSLWCWGEAGSEEALCHSLPDHTQCDPETEGTAFHREFEYPGHWDKSRTEQTLARGAVYSPQPGKEYLQLQGNFAVHFEGLAAAWGTGCVAFLWVAQSCSQCCSGADAETAGGCF